MPVDDTKSFDIQVIQQFPVFYGASLPVSMCAFNPYDQATYQQLVDWGCNAVYLRNMWTGDDANGCGPEPIEATPGDPVTGTGYSSTNIQKIKNQITFALTNGLYPWLGMQNSYDLVCREPVTGTYGWSNPYGGDFINLNTQPNNCSTDVQTPMPGRQRYLNLLQYLCTQFKPWEVAFVPWDFPYHMQNTSSSIRTQFYAQLNVEGYDGTQALMIKRIRETDEATWGTDPNYHPRYLGISPLEQGAGYDTNGYLTATGELQHYQPFYADGYPFYGEYIWYGYDSHDGGYANSGWPKTSCWGYIVRAADPATGYITHWDYNLSRYDIMWWGVPTFQQAHPMAKVMCWEWVGLGIHYTSTGGGVAQMGERPIDPSRLNWSHNMFNRAREVGSSYMFFDYWGPRPGKPLSAADPIEGGGNYEHPSQTNGNPNEMAWMFRYHNTLSDAGQYTWSDGTHHTMQQITGQTVPVDYDHWVNP